MSSQPPRGPYPGDSEPLPAGDAAGLPPSHGWNDPLMHPPGSFPPDPYSDRPPLGTDYPQGPYPGADYPGGAYAQDPWAGQDPSAQAYPGGRQPAQPGSPARRKSNRRFTWILLLVVGVAALYVWLNRGTPGEAPLRANDEYRPSPRRTAPPPTPAESAAMPAPYAPLPPPAPTAAPAAAAAPAPDNSAERARLAAEAAEARRRERLRSPLLLPGAGGGVSGAVAAATGAGQSLAPGSLASNDPAADATARVAGTAAGIVNALTGPRELSPMAAVATSNSGFLDKAASRATPQVSAASAITQLDRKILEGKLISAVLETAVNSDLPGYIRAMVDEDVYAERGRDVMIPRMTRLIGEYNSQVRNGQTRVLVVWRRAILPNGVTVQLGSYGADSLGRGGMAGEVDKHFMERFGNAFIVSLLGNGLVGALIGDSGTVVYSPYGTYSSARDAYRMDVMESLNNQLERMTSENIRIPPTIRVHQGSRVKVFVSKDIDFTDVLGQTRHTAAR